MDIRYVLKVQKYITVVPIKVYLMLNHRLYIASVNTAVHIGGVYATDKLRRVELYREEVSNEQLYHLCIK